MEDSHDTINRSARKTTAKKTNPVLSRSASQGSLESISSQPDDPSVVKAKRSLSSNIKRSLFKFNWFRVKMSLFFIGILVLFVFSTVLFTAADASRDRYQDYLLLKKDILDQKTTRSYWRTIWNFIYFRNAVILVALIDLFTIFMVITVRYS